MTVDSERDINYSSSYDDQEFVKANDEESRLKFLTAKLNAEIDLTSHNVLSLERLQERYHMDGLAAKADDRVGYYMRYIAAGDRINVLIQARFLPYKPVGKDGKFNE